MEFLFWDLQSRWSRLHTNPVAEWNDSGYCSEDRLQDCGYCLLGGIFVQIKCQDCPSFSFKIFFFAQFLSIQYVMPRNSKAGESIECLQSIPHRDPQRPWLESKARTQWFITCSVWVWEQKLQKHRLCDGCISNLAITLNKWRSLSLPLRLDPVKIKAHFMRF